MTKINLNQSPYFDDSNESKKFYKILFRPGRAVQARELTQLQTILQKQIERFGSNIFDEGAQVLPGNKDGVRYVSNNGFIKIPGDNNANDATELESYWLGKTIISSSGATGITAKVIGYRVPNKDVHARLFLEYQNSDIATGTSHAFGPGQQISTVEAVSISANIIPGEYSVGLTASVIIENGVYFFGGNFVLVNEQRIFLDPVDPTNQSKWNNAPTALVGLRITESVVTSEDDETLLDNATGTPNYAAPGADRLAIATDLVQTTLSDADKDFIGLIQVIEGSVSMLRNPNNDYNVIETHLARRTYDESGDYSVIPFRLEVKDFLRNETNNGVRSIEEFKKATEDEAKLLSMDTVLGFGLPLPSAVYHEPFLKWIPGTSYNLPGDPTSFIQLCDDRLALRIDSGKAYVKGFEIEKQSTSTVTLKKARTLRYRDNKNIDTPLGTYFPVNDLWGSLALDEYDLVELHSYRRTSVDGQSPGAKIGTARTLALDFHSGVTGSSTAEYRLFLFDIKLLPGYDLDQVKSVYASSPNFVCNTKLQSLKLTGSVSGTATATPSIFTGVGTIWKNDELERLKKDDFVQVGTGSSARLCRVVSTPSNDNQLTLILDSREAPPLEPFVGVTCSYVYSLINSNSTKAGLLYNLPDQFVYTVRGGKQDTIDANAIDNVYVTRRTLGTSLSAVGTPPKLNFSIPVSSNEEFDNFSFSYAVVNTATGDWLELSTMDLGSPAPGKAEIQALGTNLTVHLPTGTPTTDRFAVYAPIIHSNGKERYKTLQKGSFTLGVYTAGAPFVGSVGADVSEISLGVADVLRITRIVEGPPGYGADASAAQVLPADNKDITGLYILDDGQRDTHYDIAKVTLRPGMSRPQGRVRVEFDYFTHGPDGDFFSVDSYPFKGPGKKMDYDEIPDYSASDGAYYHLAGCLDFRPRVKAAGINSGFDTSLELPIDRFRCDYHFYEGRADKLYIDKFGTFLIKSGIPSIRPSPPDDPSTGMVIYELRLAPYTANPKSCLPAPRDNKRYTMRDIGKLENRISNLEYYTKLSLLESDTKSLIIKDAAGNDKFKNGFLVDNFGSYSACDPSNADFKCSLDHTNKNARPSFIEDNVSLFEKVLLDPAGDASRETLRRVTYNYQKTGDVFTLKYIPVELTQQRKASKVTTVNPFRVSNYVGDIEIYPWSDEWRDTQPGENIHIKDDSQYNAAAAANALTKPYQSTVNNWIGAQITEPSGEGNAGQYIEIAGHEFLRGKTEAQIKKIKRQGSIVIPPGYANSGMAVPLGRSTFYQKQLRTTTTMSSKAISTVTSEKFKDEGWTTPVSYGKRIIETASAEYIRERFITFNAKGFKPNSRLYAFFDDVSIDADVAPGVVVKDYDPLNIATGEELDLETKFNANKGTAIQCDGKGRVKGTFRIPNREDKRFRTGDRSFRLTTSPINEKNPSAGKPESAADTRYTARGWIDIVAETTYSQRLYSISQESTTSSTDLDPIITTTYSLDGTACAKDPIAQAFIIRDNGGCFITSVDIFFFTKPTDPANQPSITLELRTLGDEGFPSRIIIGGKLGTVVKQAGEVITNQIDLTLGKLKVVGYASDDLDEIPATADITGPWQVPDTREPSGFRTVTSTTSLKDNSFSYDIKDPAAQFVPTKFTFKSPLYLQEGKSYCFVLLSDTQEYRVWIAQKGQDTILGRETEEAIYTFRDIGDINTEIGTDTPIETPPFSDGAFFKSENGISWSIDAISAVKFKAWKAEFNTSVNAEIDFVNKELPIKTLTLDPFETKAGQSLVRVLHPNHSHTATGDPAKVVFTPSYDRILTGTLTSSGTDITGISTQLNTQLVEGSFIQHPITREQKKVLGPITATACSIESPFTQAQLSGTSGVLGTSYLVASGANLNGIDASVVYDFAGHLIQKTELDYYIIDLGILGVATATGRTGGSSIRATENKRFEELTLLTTPLTIDETDITWAVQTTSSAGVNDSTNETYVVQPYKNISPSEKIVFDKPMQVSSYINEAQPPSQVTPTVLGDTKSLTIKAILKSTNKNLSPIVDFSRFSVALLANRLDTPYGILGVGIDPASVINTIFDDYTCLPTTVAPAVVSTSNKIHFSDSTGLLSGLATTDALMDPTKVIGNGTTKFLSELKVGSVIVEQSTGQEQKKIVVSIESDNELHVDIGYLTSFTLGALHTTALNMKIKTDNIEVSKHLSKLDVGKYVTLTGTGLLTRAITTPVRILGVSYTPDNKVNLNITLLGTLSSDGVNVTGMATNFLTALAPGHFIEHPVTKEVRRVSSVVGNTDLTLMRAFTTNLSENVCSATSAPVSSNVFDSDLDAPKLCEIEFDHTTLITESIPSIPITIIQKDRFIDEIAPMGGSVASKYVSKKLSIPRPSNSLKIQFDAHRDESIILELYYKIEPSNSSVDIDSINWIKQEFNLEIDGTLQNITPKPNDGEQYYSTYQADILNLTPFVGAVAKIVMRGGNPGRVPLIKNFTLVALDD